MENFTVYSSSAGSGKTFTLTKEFLKIILIKSDPQYFKHVLAITFTNAATREMKQRLMDALKDISTNISNEYGVQISKETGIETSTLSARAKVIFEEIINNYSLLSIMTLDAFSSQIVNTFKYDLNLPYSYETVLNKNEVVSAAIKNIFDQIGIDAELEKIIKNFAFSKLDDDADWQKIVSNVEEKYLEFFEKNNISIENFNILDDETYEILINKSKKYLKRTFEVIKENAQKGMDLIHSKNLTQSDFFQGDKGIYGYFNKRASLQFYDLNEKLVMNLFVITTINEDKWQKSKADNPEIPTIKNELKAYVLTIEKHFDNIKIFVLQSFLKEVYVFRLMKRIAEEVEKILAEKNQAFLSSFGDRINTIVKDEPVPFIYERMGEYYKHILLDEFQDTSSQQFVNILPLLENAMANGTNCLIVGDEKQSIYAFRGGNATLLPYLGSSTNVELLKEELNLNYHQEDQLNAILRELKSEKLAFNYRSSKEVIAFNNRFFEFISKSTTLDFIVKFYQNAFQETPINALEGGYVVFEHAASEEVNQKLFVEINRLVTTGYGLGDMAILLNNNHQASEIARFLNAEGFEINTKEALNIKNKTEVKFIVSLLKVINEPNNSFHKFSALQYFSAWANVVFEDSNRLSDLPLFQFLQVFSQNSYTLNTDEITQEDFYRSSEYIIQVFDFMASDGLSDFMFCFLDLTLNFAAKTSTSLPDFLHFWDSGKNFSVANSKSNAITISTIHKSKGLEYPVVFIPHCDWSLSGKSSNVWIDLEKNNLDYEELQHNGIKVTALPLKMKKETVEFFQEFETKGNIDTLESINKTYVAFTRASERLYIWSEKLNDKSAEGSKTKRKTDEGKNIEIELPSKITGILKNYALNTRGFDVFEKLVIYEGVDRPLKNHFKLPEDTIAFVPPKIDFDTNLKIRFAAYEKSSVPDITFGKQMHLALEKFMSLADVDLVMAFIDKESGFDEADKIKAKDIILVLSENIELKDCFSPQAQIKIEAEILQNNKKIYRPDRIAITSNITYVLDYKTGAKTDANATGHAKQIRNYGQLLTQMGYSNVKMYIVYFQNFEVINVDFKDLQTPKDTQLNIF